MPESGKAESVLDWVVAYAVAAFAGLLVLRTYLGIGTLAYMVPLGLLTIAGGIRLTRYNQKIPNPVGFYVAGWVLLVGWLMMATLWRKWGIDVQQEVILLGGLLVVAVTAAIALSPRAVERVSPAFWVVGLLVAVFLFVRYAQAGSLRGYGKVLGGSYLVVARVLGLGAVSASLCLLVLKHRSFVLWFVSPLLLIALALSLARGALISTLAILFVAALYMSARLQASRQTIWTWFSSRVKKWSLGFGVIGIVGLTIFLAFQVERTAVRLRRLFFSFGEELEAGGRGTLWSTALENITEAPLIGYGLGSSGVMAGAHEGYYPHNLLLQVWLDGGLVAFLLLSILIAYPFFFALWRVVRQEIRSTVWVPHLGLFTFLVLEYSKSTNFYTGRLLVVMGVVAVWAVYSFAKDEYASE